MSDDQPVTKPDKKPFLPEQPPPPPPPTILPEEPPPSHPPDRCPDEDADLDAETDVDPPQRPSVPGPARAPDRHDAIITSSGTGRWIAAGRFGDYAITG